MIQDFTFRVNDIEVTVNQEKLTGRQILEKAGFNPPDEFELLLETDKDEFDFIRLDEDVDLQVRGVEKFQANLKGLVSITVNDHVIKIRSKSSPNEILTEVGKSPEHFFLVEVREKMEISLENDGNAELSLTNGTVFIIKDRKGNGHPLDKKIRLKFIVNGDEFEDEFNVNQRLKGAVEKALVETGNGNEPLSRWTVKYNNQTLDINKKIEEFGFPEGAIIMISLKAGKGGV